MSAVPRWLVVVCCPKEALEFKYQMNGTQKETPGESANATLTGPTNSRLVRPDSPPCDGSDDGSACTSRISVQQVSGSCFSFQRGPFWWNPAAGAFGEPGSSNLQPLQLWRAFENMTFSNGLHLPPHEIASRSNESSLIEKAPWFLLHKTHMVFWVAPDLSSARQPYKEPK